MGSDQSRSFPVSPSSTPTKVRSPKADSPLPARPKTKNRYGIGGELLFKLNRAITLSPDEQPMARPGDVSTSAYRDDLSASDGDSKWVHIEESTLASSETSSVSGADEPPATRKPLQLYPAVFQWDVVTGSIYVVREKKLRSVLLAGSYDNWATKTPLVQSSETYYTILNLPEGGHHYLYCVNGDWRCCDRQEKGILENKQETNYVEVKSKYEVYAALEADGEAEAYDSVRYNQDVPKSPGRHSKPPLLPPQILQIIVNKVTPAAVDPGLLPLPDHVMLNHLYVLMKGHECGEKQEKEEKPGGNEKEQKEKAKKKKRRVKKKQQVTKDQEKKDQKVQKEQQAKKEQQTKKEQANKEQEAKKEPRAKNAQQAKKKQRAKKAKEVKPKKEKKEAFEETEHKEATVVAKEEEQIFLLSDFEQWQHTQKPGFYTTVRFRKVCVTTVYYR